MYPSNIIFSEVNAGIKQTINPKLWEMLEPLVLDYPTWQFKEYSYGCEYEKDASGKHTTSQTISHEFQVIINGESSGRIGVQTWNKKLWLSNDRIQQALDRRRAMVTGDVKKAIKLFKKYFFSKTDLERVKDKVGYTQGKFSSLSNDKEYKVRNMYAEMRKPLLEFLCLHLDEFLNYTMKNHPVFPKMAYIPDIPTMLDEVKGVQNMIDALNNGNAVIVDISLGEDKYALSSKDGEEIKILFRDEIPQQLIQRIGMLKLVEYGQAIMGVGFRADKNSFVIMTT